jgi:hypothetical protein
MRRFLVLLGLAASAVALLLASCDTEGTPNIPIEIVSVVPAAGSDIGTGSHFKVTVNYRIPAMESGLSYEVYVGFESTYGGSTGGTTQTVTRPSGTVVIEFDFVANSRMVYPYVMQATLYERHPDYGYIIENSGRVEYY